MDGLVIHDGESLKNGKWFSYVRNSHFESWTMYDSAERAVEREATVLDDDPYLLFYSKVETPATSGLDSRSVPNAVGGPSRFCVPSKDSQRFVTSTDRVSKSSSTNGVSTSANSESTSKSANSGNNNEHNSIGDRKIRPINVDREQRNEPIIPVVDIDSDESSDGELQVLDSSDEKEIPNHLQQGENIGKKGERFIRKWTKRISMPEWARSLRIRRLRKPILEGKDKSKRAAKKIKNMPTDPRRLRKPICKGKNKKAAKNVKNLPTDPRDEVIELSKNLPNDPLDQIFELPKTLTRKQKLNGSYRLKLKYANILCSILIYFPF